MEEPLLCTNRPRHSSSCYSCEEGQRNKDECDQCNDTFRGGQSTTRLSKAESSPSSSPESSTFFSFLRPKFFLAGFLFGAFVESLYVQTIRLGLITAENQKTDGDSDYTIQALKTWTDVFFYELSFMCCDVIFLLYMMILTLQALKKKLNINLPIMAANWTQGMVLGLSVTVATLIGPKVVLQQQFWQILGSVVVGNALCFVAYDTVSEMQKRCMMSGQRPFVRASASSLSCCSVDKTEEQESPQRHCDDGVHDPNTMPFIEAHILV